MPIPKTLKKLMNGIRYKGGASDLDKPIEIDMVVVFRYVLLIVLYMLSFIYIFQQEYQFIFIVIIFILHVFGSIFLMRDIFTNEEMMEKLFYDEFTPTALSTDNPTFLKIFIAVIFIGIILKMVSLIMMIDVFDYGQTQLNNYSGSFGMSSSNTEKMYNYKLMYIFSSILIMFLSYTIFSAYGHPKFQAAVRNIFAIIMSVTILGVSSYEIVYANDFLQIKNRKGELYQLST